LENLQAYQKSNGAFMSEVRSARFSRYGGRDCWESFILVLEVECSWCADSHA